MHGSSWLALVEARVRFEPLPDRAGDMRCPVGDEEGLWAMSKLSLAARRPWVSSARRYVPCEGGGLLTKVRWRVIL